MRYFSTKLLPSRTLPAIALRNVFSYIAHNQERVAREMSNFISSHKEADPCPKFYLCFPENKFNGHVFFVSKPNKVISGLFADIRMFMWAR